MSAVDETPTPIRRMAPGLFLGALAAAAAAVVSARIGARFLGDARGEAVGVAADRLATDVASGSYVTFEARLDPGRVGYLQSAGGKMGYLLTSQAGPEVVLFCAPHSECSRYVGTHGPLPGKERPQSASFGQPVVLSGRLFDESAVASRRDVSIADIRRYAAAGRDGGRPATSSGAARSSPPDALRVVWLDVTPASERVRAWIALGASLLLGISAAGTGAAVFRRR